MERVCVAEITEAAQDGAEFLGIVVIFTLLHSMGREIGQKLCATQMQAKFLCGESTLGSRGTLGTCILRN